MTQETRFRVIRDPLWNSIRLDPTAVRIMDTAAFQRLRYIRQLGLAHLVYPGATHTRFDHALGVYHLAGEGVAVKPVDFVSPEGLEFFTPRNLAPEPAHRVTLRPAEVRRDDHRDVVVPLIEQEAREEAARCLLCAMCRSCSACTDLFGCPAFREVDGRIVIDELLCNGCGVCMSFCPNGAIREVTES